jgi:hypothetical protein
MVLRLKLFQHFSLLSIYGSLNWLEIVAGSLYVFRIVDGWEWDIPHMVDYSILF